MPDLDATSSAPGQPIFRFATGLTEFWRFLTRPASADFRSETASHVVGGITCDTDEEAHAKRDRDKLHPFSDGFNLHHF